MAILHYARTDFYFGSEWGGGGGGEVLIFEGPFSG